MKCYVINIAGRKVLAVGVKLVDAGCGNVWVTSEKTSQTITTVRQEDVQEVSNAEAVATIEELKAQAPGEKLKVLLIKTEMDSKPFDPRNN